MSSKHAKHLVIPDTQCRPGVPLDHLLWAGRYALEKRPDVIVHLGDHWDMPSLSSWDSATKKAQKKRAYLSGKDKGVGDIEAGNRGLELFMKPLLKYNKKAMKSRRYTPRLVMIRGNHENRITRAIEQEPWLEGAISQEHFNDKALGWEVVPFLKPIKIGGILFCHYFCRGSNGTVAQTRRGSPSAKAQVVREGCSAIAGHKQGLDVHIQPTGDGMRRGIIAGSFYQHDEEYMSPQGQNHWRGILLLHDVYQGEFDLCEVSLAHLKRRYS